MAKMKSNKERFLEKFDKNAPNGCWEWKGAKVGSGYGEFWFEGAMVLAHRFSYELFKGPIPEGKLVCHMCANRRCVNPDHLWLGTHKENTEDCILKGRFSKGNKHYSVLSPEKICRGENIGRALNRIK